MAVFHLEHQSDPSKTLCGRTRTPRYKVVNIERMAFARESNGMDGEEWIVRQMREKICSRCEAKAERLGLLERIKPISSGDIHHDNWLTRLGVTE